MGFNSVYRVLQDVFPQVDARMLRAVAIEHPKDADAAVEVVLVEVIPYLSGGSAVSGSFDDTVEDASDPAPKVDISLTDQMVETPNGSSSCDANGDGDKVSKYTGKDELVSLGKQEEINANIVHDAIYCDTLISKVHKDTTDNGVDDQVRMKNEGGEFMSVMQDLSSVRVGLDQGSHVSSPVSNPGCTNEIMSSNLLVGRENLDGHSSCDCNIVNYGESLHAQPPLDDNQLDKEKSVVLVASLPVQECKPDTPEGCLQLAAEQAVNSDWEKLEPDGTTNVASKENMDTRDMVQFEDENPSNTIVTRSGQICRIDLLEDIIEDAKSNKKTLFLAMESVISLMREVELQEKAAEQAREEAIRGSWTFSQRWKISKQCCNMQRKQMTCMREKHMERRPFLQLKQGNFNLACLACQMKEINLLQFLMRCVKLLRKEWMQQKKTGEQQSKRGWKRKSQQEKHLLSRNSSWRRWFRSQRC